MFGHSSMSNEGVKGQVWSVRLQPCRINKLLQRQCRCFDRLTVTEALNSWCVHPRGCAATPSVTVKLKDMRATWPWARLLPVTLLKALFNVSGKFQALWPLASLARGRAHAWAGARARAPPKHPKPCFPRYPAILLHGLKESSRKKILNAWVKSIFRCKCVNKGVKNMPHKVGSTGIPRPVDLSHFCTSGGFQDLRPLCAALVMPT